MTATRNSDTYQPVDPRELGVRSGLKHYLTMLVTTDQGRWSVLLWAMITIIGNQVQTTVYPGIAALSPAEVTLYVTVAMIVVGAALLNVLFDMVRVATGDKRGER